MSFSSILVLLLAAFARCAGGFEVLYAGAPRSGTQTMYTALKILGLNPLHSGYSHKLRPPMCEYLYGSPVILPVMDVEDWYVSEQNYFKDWAYPIEHKEVEMADAVWKVPKNVSYDVWDAVWEMQYKSDFTLDHCWACRYWDCAFYKEQGMPAEQNQTCKDGYQAHMDRVKTRVPPSRLLIFNFSDGWAPLCHFLGRPIPEEPFPYTDKFNKDTPDVEALSTSFLQDGIELLPTPRGSEL
ncbi:hypothetical protein AK812_SmicGene19136 [Symbiodinium microadriaticum]|uniref:Uncharacterized protein n=1 Tax=Symbiodinium microadriaticum TaxID=2951 RepID=A0A1Q9DTD3_SYMMI|nr:hypothetical protein AK812_SmicGene19136 [Symbiodinium microadriaticum]